MDEEPRRRIRRNRRGYSTSGQGDSTVAYGSVGDEVDQVVDVDAAVEEMAVNRGSQLTSADEDPTEAMVRNRGVRSQDYEKELRLRLTHRLLMRGMPEHKIAEKIGVTVETVIRYKRELATRMRDAAAQMDLNELIGEGMAFYNEVQALGLQTASQSNVPTNLKLAAMRTSLAAKNDQHRFLQAAGVFDVLRFKPKEQSEGDDMKQLVHATRALLFGEDGEAEQVHQEN